MDWVIYECSGTVKSPLFWEKYDWVLKLFENRVEIVRNGKIRAGGPAKEAIIYFDDVTSVVFGSCDIIGGTVDTWIAFIVPGVQNTNATMSTTNITGGFSLSSVSSSSVAEQPQWDNTYAVIRRDKRGEQTLKQAYEVIREYYDKYRHSASADSAPQRNSVETPYEKLKMLKGLHDMGILNAEEYEEKRRVLLADL